MSRSIREESKLGCYHVMQRGAGKQILFEDEEDYTRYYHKLVYCRKELDFELLMCIVLYGKSVPLYTNFTLSPSPKKVENIC